MSTVSPRAPAGPPVRTRFAPSPTGLLHIGNIRTATLGWLLAKKSGGAFLLRIDDTDRERSRPELAEAIRDDLRWLGLGWDEQHVQSERLGRYREIVERLIAEGWLYACYESEAELDRQRKRRLAQGLPPVYDRTGLRLTREERTRLEAEGRRPHWRFLLSGPTGATPGGRHEATWRDGIRGEQTIDVAGLSDPVLVREDGAFLYTLASVVDDVDMAITDIVRGEDHVTNTAVQIRIFQALGAEIPRFAHHSLIVGADGEALSKRLGTLSIRSMREDGLEAMAVVSLAATIGRSEPVGVRQSLGELVEGFELTSLARAPARFDMAELRQLNARLLHAREHAEVADRLAGLGVGGGAEFWEAVRGNVERLADALEWWRIVGEPIEPGRESPEICRAAAEALPAEPWNASTWSREGWQAFIEAVKQATGAKGRALFHPLRLALTGVEAGPELARLLPFMGHERARRRLLGERA